MTIYIVAGSAATLAAGAAVTLYGGYKLYAASKNIPVLPAGADAILQRTHSDDLTRINGQKNWAIKCIGIGVLLAQGL